MVVGFCLLFDLRLWSTNQTINQEKSSARDYVFCVFVCFVCFVCFRLLRITHPLRPITYLTSRITHPLASNHTPAPLGNVGFRRKVGRRTGRAALSMATEPRLQCWCARSKLQPRLSCNRCLNECWLIFPAIVLLEL